jgi:hypothetical protein
MSCWQAESREMVAREKEVEWEDIQNQIKRVL